MSDLYNYLCTEKTSNIHKVGMFHSETTDEKKSDIIKKLQDIAKLSCSTFIWYTIYNNRHGPGSWQNWEGRQKIHCFVVVQ